MCAQQSGCVLHPCQVARADLWPTVVVVAVMQSRPFGVALLIGGWDSEGPVL